MTSIRALKKRSRPSRPSRPLTRRDVLIAYSKGIVVRRIAMELLGLEWYGDLLVEMRREGLRIRLPRYEQLRMRASAREVLKPEQVTPAPPRDREARRRAIDQARASVRLEGTILPPEVEELNRRFVDGEISAEEHLRLGLAFADAMAARGRPA